MTRATHVFANCMVCGEMISGQNRVGYETIGHFVDCYTLHAGRNIGIQLSGMIVRKLSEENQMKKGLLMVLSGNAEDKTVSAFGQVFRALGQGVKVCVIEFSGESWLSRSHFSERFKDLLTVHALGNDLSGESENPSPDPEDRAKSLEVGQGDHQLWKIPDGGAQRVYVFAGT